MAVGKKSVLLIIEVHENRPTNTIIDSITKNNRTDYTAQSIDDNRINRTVLQ